MFIFIDVVPAFGIFDKFIERSVPLFTKPVSDLWNAMDAVEDLPFRDQPIVGHSNVDIEIIWFVDDGVMEMPVDVEGLVSDRGRGGLMKTICQLLKENKSPIVLIISTQKNPIVHYANHLIYMSSYDNHYQKVSSFSTRMTLLYILDTLYAVYFSLNYEELLNKKITAYEKIYKVRSRTTDN